MHLSSVEATRAFAEQFVKGLTPHATRATVVGLSGELGSGKTTFVQAVAHALGITEMVTSPTFVIEKIYAVADPRFTHFVHIDAYRLESGKELQTLGWDALIAQKGNLVMIEWPERVAEILPADMEQLTFTFIDDHTRQIVTVHE